jgi:hypothetical protein
LPLCLQLNLSTRNSFGLGECPSGLRLGGAGGLSRDACSIGLSSLRFAALLSLDPPCSLRRRLCRSSLLAGATAVLQGRPGLALAARAGIILRTFGSPLRVQLGGG